MLHTSYIACNKHQITQVYIILFTYYNIFVILCMYMYVYTVEEEYIILFTNIFVILCMYMYVYMVEEEPL